MFMPDYYEFCCRPKTISGHDAADRIPEALDGLKASRPLIITDEGVVKAGLSDIIIRAMGKKMKPAAIADFVPADSDVETVNEIAAMYRANKCDSIIAVGGGSPIDTAKGVNILATLGGSDVMKYCGVGRVTKKLNPFIVVPTTSGTGSEMTLVAVIGDHKNHVKLAFTSYFLLPDYAILDSRMTATLPPALTAATGMDAMSHACEAYICMSKNPLSDVTAMEAIRLISENLVSVVRNPSDLEGRLALAEASMMAGAAFSNSMVGMVHNIGHAIGGACGVPHGTCMAILLPYGIEFNMHRIGAYAADLLLPLAGEEEYRKTPPAQRAQKSVECLRSMNQALHEATGGRHPRFLSEVTGRDGKPMIRKEDFDRIIRNAQDDPAQFYNPEEMDTNEYRMVLECAWDGRPVEKKRIKISHRVC